MFTESQRKEFIEDGLSDEEIDTLENALAMSETIDLLPDDIEAFIKEYESKIPDDTMGGIKAILFAAEKDPKFFNQLMALNLALATEMNENVPTQKLEETIITKLPDNEYKKASENYFRILSSLSASDRDEFMKLVMNMNEEQKTDMVDRLTK